MLSLDPSNRVVAMLIYGSKLVVIPLDRADVPVPDKASEK